MDITPAQLERYRRSAQERETARNRRLAVRWERAWQLTHQAAALLKQEFGATRVVVFGSLLHSELFHEHSDIDLVVWDIQHYYRSIFPTNTLAP